MAKRPDPNSRVRPTKDIEYAPAAPGTWRDGIEATASHLYAALFEGGNWPAPHQDYPALNKLVATLKDVAPCCSQNSPTCTSSPSH